jgi:protein-S-isoprenylcysteine O-methyltransferase Ste14
MARTTEQKSTLYGLAQTCILVVFAVTVFLAPGTPMLTGGLTLRLAGNGLCAVGIILLLVAISRIGQSIQIAPEPKKTATLVTSGVYRWFRHPIYTSIVAVVIGLFLRKPTPGIGIAAAIVIIFLLVKVRFEEKLLRARYPEYSAYMNRSMGILPWADWISRNDGKQK